MNEWNSRMQSSLKMEKPGDARFTMSITMPLKDWELLRDQLRSGQPQIFPSNELNEAIDELVNRANKVFLHTVHPPHGKDEESK